MADGTGIEWTDATWNPVTGCSVLDPEALIAKTYAQVISEGMAIYHNEGNDIQSRRAVRAFIDRFELRARITSGETREEVGS